MNLPSTTSGLELITTSLVEPSLQRICTCSSRSVSPASTRASRAAAWPDCTTKSAIGPADVLGGLVAEQVELGAVRPADDAVGVDLVQADDRVLQKIGELHLALGELRFEELASLELALQPLHAAFEPRDESGALVRIADGLRIAVVDRSRAMRRADVAEALAIADAQLIDVVAAQQCERLVALRDRSTELRAAARRLVAPLSHSSPTISP